MTLLLGYNTNGFAHHALGDALDILAEIGYRAVGLTLDVHHAPLGASDYPRLGREIRARGLLPVVETGARFLLDARSKHCPSLLSREGRERRIDFYFQALEAAADLGAPCISLWSGRDEGGDSWAWLMEGLHRVLARAGQLGLDVGFEPEPGMFVATMAQWEELVRQLPHPRLKLTLDAGHVVCLEREPPAAVVERESARLINVHLDDQRPGVHEHLMFGEGALDLAPLLAALQRAAAGRDLPATVELSRHSHDAVAVARRAFALLQEAGA